MRGKGIDRMSSDNGIELEDDYFDVEEALEMRKFSQKTIKSIKNMADFYRSQEQLKNRGNLLGHYKSSGFSKTYIDVYEQAIIGKVEFNGSKIVKDISFGYVYLVKAVADNTALYLMMSDEKIYRLRHLKMAEMIAYTINGQKMKITQGEGRNE